MAALQAGRSQFSQFRKHICFNRQLLKNLWPELKWFQFDHWYLDVDEEEGGRQRLRLKRKNRCKEKRVETPLLSLSLLLSSLFSHCGLTLHSCFSLSNLAFVFYTNSLPRPLSPLSSFCFLSSLSVFFTGFPIPPFFPSISSHLSVRFVCPAILFAAPRLRHMALSFLLLSSINTVVSGNYRHIAQHARLCCGVWCWRQNKAGKDKRARTKISYTALPQTRNVLWWKINMIFVIFI